MYKKNIVPLPEVSADPRFGPQINTSSEIGFGVGVNVGVGVLGCVFCRVHYSAHEQDGTWNGKHRISD